MTAFEILIGTYLAVVPPALGVLFWGRLNRLENRIDALELKMAAEFADVRRQIAELRSEVRQEFSDVRKEITALRSDLTQVALAVSPRPRASEA